MKKGFVFTASLAALTLGLVACGGGGGSDVPDVKITNKAELQTEWFVEDDDRGITMSIEGVRISDAIDVGDLVVTSSNPAVASIDQTTFRKVHAEGVGKTTISAVYKNAKSDSVEIEVKSRPTYRVATTLDPEKDDYKLRWYIGPKAYYAAGTKGQVDTKSPYYLDPAENLDTAMDLSVDVEDVEGDYKYSITFSNGSTIGQKRDASHCNIGFTSETGYAKTLFKLNSDYSLSCLIPVGESAPTAADEYFLAVYGGTNTKRLAFQKGTGIPAVGYARIIELGDPIPATSVTLSETELTLKDGQAAKLTATIEPAISTDVVSWESSAPTTAYVEDGRIWALKEGEATITATAGKVSASCKVTISGALNYGSEEEPLTPEQAHDLIAENFADGSQTVKMLYVRGVAEAVNKTYQSGDNVTVNLRKTDGSYEAKYMTFYGALPEEGVVTPEADDTVVAKGYAKVYSNEYELAPGKAPAATSNTNPSIISVTKAVPPTLEDIEISGVASVNLYGKTEAQTVQLTAAPVPAKAALGTVSWQSSDEAVTVSEAGLVTIPLDYVAEGGDSKTVTFTASNGTVTSSEAFSIVVKNEEEVAPVEPVVLTKESITMLDESQSSTYAKYNGVHDFTDYAFSTTSVMPNTYAAQSLDVIQFKAKEGTLTFTKGAFTKVTLKVYSTYDWDLTIGVNGNYGDNTQMNANRVETEYYTESSGKQYKVYLYTLEVTLEGATEGITITKHPSKQGAGYVQSITLA